MSKTAQAIIYLVSGIALGAVLITAIASKKIDPGTTSVEISKEGRPHYKWHAPHLPAKLDFCGESVPLDDWDVRERLDRELTINAYLHGTQLQVLKLKGRYFPMIEKRLKENGVPDDIKYVCVAESALRLEALSRVRAASLWQFMKSTAPGYGLEVNSEVDERYNVEKATDAACQYFKKAHERFGSWTAAAASYNCGMNGLARRAERQGESNYYNLMLPEETNRYVFRILALKYLLEHPDKFGMTISNSEEYRPIKYKTITVYKSIPDLTAFAKEHRTTYRKLILYNPWLKSYKLTISRGNSYEIHLPM